MKTLSTIIFSLFIALLIAKPTEASCGRDTIESVQNKTEITTDKNAEHLKPEPCKPEEKLLKPAEKDVQAKSDRPTPAPAPFISPENKQPAGDAEERYRQKGLKEKPEIKPERAEEAKEAK